MNKILLVGCGHMGSALLKAWTLSTNNRFFVIDPVKYKKINNNYKKKVNAFKSLSEINNLTSFDIIVFAVKPQIAPRVLNDFKRYNLKNKTIFVSIIAGKKIKFFDKFLPKNNQFIRVMPNMPVVINKGVSCLFANKNISKNNIKIINSLFLKVGKTFWLKDEQAINKVTAISGSGPGYIFLLIDAFEKAAAKLGLGEKITKNLVHQTFLGSIEFFLKEKKSAYLLSKNIAIKGGTTEAGLLEFKRKKLLHQTFQKVIKAAYKKSIQLSK